MLIKVYGRSWGKKKDKSILLSSVSRAVSILLVLILAMGGIIDDSTSGVVHAAGTLALSSAKLSPTYEDDTTTPADKRKYMAGSEVIVSVVEDGITPIVFNTTDETKFANKNMLAFQWQYQDGETWKAIDGATDYKYVPGIEMAGKLIRCHIEGLESGLYGGSEVFVDGEKSFPTDIGMVFGTEVVKPVITAQDVTMTMEEARAITNDKLKTATNAEIKDIWDGIYDSNNINSPNVADVIAAGNKDGGDVKVTWKHAYADDKTITVHIIKDTISANDFNISREDTRKVLAGDDTILKTLSKIAVKYSNADVAVSDISVSDKSALKAEEGEYNVTFTYKNMSITVKATVRGKDIIFEKTNPQDKEEGLYNNLTVPATGGLKINGVTVDQYSVDSAKHIMNISKDYLSTLDVNVYPAVITYADGFEQKFNIAVIAYDEEKTVKSPPLFSMYKEIVLKKNNTFTINLSGVTSYAEVKAEVTASGSKAKKRVAVKMKDNGDVLITPKKAGKTQVTCTIIQNGAEYKVVVDIKVLKQYKGTSRNYDLNSKAIVAISGELPEFNVYKRIVKGKNTTIKFTNVEKDAVVKFYVSDKKETKYLKVGDVKRNDKTATCVIKGKKKGWVHLTAEITQNGKTYYTRLLVRIDNGKWTKKQLKKYLSL